MLENKLSSLTTLLAPMSVCWLVGWEVKLPCSYRSACCNDSLLFPITSTLNCVKFRSSGPPVRLPRGATSFRYESEFKMLCRCGGIPITNFSSLSLPPTLSTSISRSRHTAYGLASPFLLDLLFYTCTRSSRLQSHKSHNTHTHANTHTNTHTHKHTHKHTHTHIYKR